MAWRTSKLTAGTALVAGLVGALAGMLGTLITAWHEDDRSREDFLRTQRQAVYSEYLAATRTVHLALAPHVPELLLGDDRPPAPILPQEQLVAIYDDLKEVFGIIDEIDLLIGDYNISLYADIMSIDLYIGWDYLRSGYCTAHPTESDPCVETVIVDQDESYPDILFSFKNFSEHRLEFITLARQQLGAE